MGSPIECPDFGFSNYRSAHDFWSLDGLFLWWRKILIREDSPAIIVFFAGVKSLYPKHKKFSIILDGIP